MKATVDATGIVIQELDAGGKVVLTRQMTMEQYTKHCRDPGFEAAISVADRAKIAAVKDRAE